MYKKRGGGSPLPCSTLEVELVPDALDQGVRDLPLARGGGELAGGQQGLKGLYPAGELKEIGAGEDRHLEALGQAAEDIVVVVYVCILPRFCWFCLGVT